MVTLLATMTDELLPAPTVDLVKEHCIAFDEKATIKLVEEALALLRTHLARNTEISHVYLKALALNKLYSTRVEDRHVEPLARHIAGLDIDQCLDQGDLGVVDRIADCPDIKRYLSFASKYCSLHRPETYPIWDGNARECLWSYQLQDQFGDFPNDDLWVYQKYVKIVLAFRYHYRLNCYSIRQLDKFFYLSGDRILKAKAAAKAVAKAAKARGDSDSPA